MFLKVNGLLRQNPDNSGGKRKLSRKNAKIFVRISQTYCRISHFFAKINKATLCKNCFCEILRKVIFQKNSQKS